MQYSDFEDEIVYRSKVLLDHIDYLESHYGDIDGQTSTYDFALLKDMIGCVAWAYPLETREVATSDVDRLSPMIIGPLFTSEKYPWPENDGQLFEPILQFDLEWAGELAKVNLGKGILQLWLGSLLSEFNDHFIRIIPKEDFRHEFISPIPNNINIEYFSEDSYFAGQKFSWLDTLNGGKSVIITRSGNPILTWHSRLRDALEELQPILNDKDADIMAKFLEFLPITSPSPTPHLFGICHPVQYDATDVPQCLLALDSEGPFMWGDCGNAQIFYIPQADGTIGFDFAWSCY